MKYGFIGLGNLGRNLAASLVRAGFDVTVHDRDAKPLEGAAWGASPLKVAQTCHAVFTCLPSPAASEAVLTAMLPALQGKTWIEMSTIGRDEILRLAGLGTGVNVLEAPVTGGVHLAASGQITVLVGGNAALLEKHRPALAAMGDKIFHMGPLGSAALIKVITNMLAFIHLVADGEALMLAAKGGLDLRQSWEAIRASSGNSFVHETEGQLILNGSYDVGFSIDLALKDLGFAMGFGRELGVPLELAGLVQSTFARAAAEFGGAAQSTAVVRLLEEQVGVALRATGFPAKL